MTNHFYGSSLFQARKTDNNHHHRHSHLHGRSINHLRSHAQFHRRQEENETADLDPGDPTITEVVQTISVVQVIDGSGAIIETQTFASDPQTNLVDAETGSTIDTGVKAVSLTSDSAGAATTSSTATETPISSEDPVSATTETTPPSASPSDVSLTATTTSLPPAETTDATTSVVPTLSIPPSLSSSSAFPSLSSTFNSTISSFTSSSSSLLSSSSTRSNSTTVTTDTLAGSSTTSQSLSSLVTTLSSSSSADLTSGTTSSPLSSFTSSSNSPTTSSSGASSTSSDSDSVSASPSSTFGIGGGDGSAGTTILATPSSSSTSASSGSSSDNGTPPTGTVVGGVVGGVAGLALLVAFAFMLLRLRKRGWCHLRLGGGDDKSITPATRAVDAGPSGDGNGGGSGGGSGAYGTMQRSSAPYSVASSLAALAGKRSSRERSNTGSEMAERGFVRVSGKKLPPVLQYGGDGYSDPRDRSSLNSDATVYRDSMAIFNQPNSPARLALGSPMRPESGVMVYNPGPAKTPVTGEVPKTIDSPTLARNSMLPPPDDIGRTLAAQDHSHDGAASRTSRGSARFTEQLS